MEKHFTHLHLHSEFSLLDGAISLDRLIEHGKQQGLKALAITDHGNVFGGVKFFQKCKKAGIKPILGIEAYLTEDINVKSVEKKYYHIILLVQNETGYKNLCKLISFAYQKGFYFKPRIDYAALEKHSEGLIATTACLGGHIPQLLKNNQDEEANKWIDWHLRVFGKERFYLEVQPEDQEEQTIVNNKLYAIAKERGLNLLATSDCHYVNLEDRDSHEAMLCIQTHHKITDEKRFSFGPCKTYMRTKEEMLEIFKDHPEAIWNSGKIADMCNFDFETGKLLFPKFEIPEGHTQESFFKHLCEAGLQKLIDEKRIPIEDKSKYDERLKIEVDLIVSMGFIGYFLIVSDFIQWSKRNGVPVGPGRGSAAGSLVAWALEITNIDPIKYQLLFERFLNPERVTMPDIDIDFCIEGREKVIQYVRDKYGHDKVCQIITFGTMLAKGVIKDVARVLGFPFEDANAITDLIPDQLKITLKESLEQSQQMADLVNSNAEVKKLFDIALKLEGLTRHASKHAAGLVISPEPIEEVLPLYVPPKSTELVTQYAMTELESLGFLKMDMLGLKNLTLIDKAVKIIKKNHGVQLDMDHLPLEDQKTFDLVCAGNTSGVFQFESEGIKEVIRKIEPRTFEDLIHINALYRPGPLGSGMVDDFIERKHGRQKIEYLFPELEPIIKNTYGVIVYQEQVMQIASAVGGYSLGESDLLRRAMGKKKVEVMAEQKEIFLTRAKERNFDSKKANKLFELMAHFAGYGFNKSHSAAYVAIAYQTAFLKANYPAEFMACLITLEATNSEKMVFYLDEAKSMGLEIMPPDINVSEIDFSVSNNKIVFGLQGIKSVGLASLENIIEERAKEPFYDILDFCIRIDLRTSNKRVLEHLILAGAFDKLSGNRAQKMAEITRVIDTALEKKREKETGQIGMFSRPVKDTGQKQSYSFEVLDEYPEKEKLEKEKEVIGFYLSSHPLDSYKKQLSMLDISSFDATLKKINSSGQSFEQDPIASGCGIKKAIKTITTKKGDAMAFMQIEDKESSAEIVIFPRLYAKVSHLLESHDVFVVKGAVDIAARKLKIKASDLVPLENFIETWKDIPRASITLPANISAEFVEKISKTFKRGKTTLTMQFYENGKKLKLNCRGPVKIDATAIETIQTEKLTIKISL
jgi:DNA polymerase III subunit alpha